MKVFQNGGDRTGFSKQCHNASCGVLEVLKTGNLVVRKTVEKSIATVKMRGNICMKDLFSGTSLLGAHVCIHFPPFSLLPRVISNSFGVCLKAF